MQITDSPRGLAERRARHWRVLAGDAGKTGVVHSGTEGRHDGGGGLRVAPPRPLSQVLVVLLLVFCAAAALWPKRGRSRPE